MIRGIASVGELVEVNGCVDGDLKKTQQDIELKRSRGQYTTTRTAGHG
jgi:hypothetical protein